MSVSSAILHMDPPRKNIIVNQNRHSTKVEGNLHDGKMMPVVVVRCAAVNGCLGDPRMFRARRPHFGSRIRLEVAETPRELRLLVALQKYKLVLIVVNDLPYVEVLAFGATTEVHHSK